MPDGLPWNHFENHHAINRHNPTKVHVLGAGLAGCWTARTLAEAGIPVVVLEAGSHSAYAASSNPAGIVKPFISRSPGLAMCFYLEAYDYLQKRLSDWGLAEHCQYSPCGVVQLVAEPYPDSEHYQNLSCEKMADALGVACEGHGLLFQHAGWLNPSALCSALLQHPLIQLQTHYQVQSIKQLHDEGCWQIDSAGHAPLRVDQLVLGTGALLNKFVQSAALCITPARGQISRFALNPDTAALQRVVNGKHYIIPDGDTVLVGATFERDVSDDRVRSADNVQNLAGLNTTLSALSVKSEALEAFAGVRATTPDRFPLIGPLPDTERTELAYADLRHGRNLHKYPPLPVFRGAYVLGGLGSRGIVTAPFAAQLLTDFMMGGQDLAAWSALINPARFQIRALKRKRH